MYSFSCRCGSTTEIIPPSRYAGYVVRDSDVDLSIESRSTAVRSFLRSVRDGDREQWIEQFYGNTVAKARFSKKDDADIIEDILSRHDHYTRHMLQCPTCGRIYIQSSADPDTFTCYTEERHSE